MVSVRSHKAAMQRQACSAARSRRQNERLLALPALATLLLLALSVLQLAAADVVMVYVVTRHGARNVLPKDAELQENDSTGGPSLLPQGITASRAAGGCRAPPRAHGAAPQCRAQLLQTSVPTVAVACSQHCPAATSSVGLPDGQS
jgi:hypothetical protein